ncbi:group 1 truncated hemoglobin [Roseimicrobium sp. ORNL1]|uniref:group I truncated hemoglobin n=1 Tax=Roseimicrobium sp. ORNL1 TaxID=2711231 RepID=UPI0013E13375|nr:group 1 truncated hemoglobin [Roseimicrobium sp. ORNL1]QIF02350.1 group 1 truncated hemoglobin [Roseimicrobium sp. ORNL1]
MKRTILVLSLAFCSLAATAADTSKGAESTAPTCPVTGKAANPAITLVYEGNSYAFADETAKQKFSDDRANSLYQKLGGKTAIDAAVELFYVKVLADKRVNHFFEDINMNKQKRKQKEFLSAALGGPIPYAGKDLRSAHESLGGLNDSHFDAIAENLLATLTELKVDPQLIEQAMAIVGSTRDAVLNRPAKPATPAVP